VRDVRAVAEFQWAIVNRAAGAGPDSAVEPEGAGWDIPKQPAAATRITSASPSTSVRCMPD
jgi:hypothetical protein